MTSSARDLDATVADLVGNPVGLDDVRAILPAVAGLYAWWATPDVFPEIASAAHPTSPALRLLYVGQSSNLRRRIALEHLRRSGSSTLRKTLAGLLLDEQLYVTRWTSRVVLVEDDERRLTEWMRAHLQVSWCEVAAPGPVEPEILRRLGPPLNVDHGAGRARDVVRAARSRFLASAGPR